ncbi:MAG: DNA-3-methyladenine glycosylase I [Candidatus Acidiferrales bacterium]|nr:DNA-3-methyladenine glycosylase I [Candidatus Acidoferrales bacterium]
MNPATSAIRATSSGKHPCRRCAWAKSEISIQYHDEEWGVPVHDDRTLFEMMILEGAQAGLSWETVLRKRARYREVFDNFDVKRIARYDRRRVRKLLADPGIIRNRFKIAATIQNATMFLAVQKEFGSFDAYLWRFVEGRPLKNARRGRGVPARTRESDALSKDLQKRGFKFVGSTICYAMMQAIGMVNDHNVDCFRHGEIG